MILHTDSNSTDKSVPFIQLDTQQRESIIRIKYQRLCFYLPPDWLFCDVNEPTAGFNQIIDT